MRVTVKKNVVVSPGAPSGCADASALMLRVGGGGESSLEMVAIAEALEGEMDAFVGDVRVTEKVSSCSRMLSPATSMEMI